MAESAATYLPHLLRDWYRAHPTEIHEQSEYRGTLLFADASGFTALTRSLGEEGRVGFEILTNLLNAVFRGLEQAIAAHHGDILKFSGDAVWCWFPPGTECAGVFAAMKEQVARLNEAEAICRRFPLSLHAGACHGMFKLVTVRVSNDRLDYEIFGEAVERAYAAADEATAGQLVVSGAIGSPTAVGARGRMAWAAAETAGTLAPLLQYIPGAIRARLVEASADNDLNSEHRNVSVLFVLAAARKPDADAGAIARELARIMTTIDHNGGMIARIDPFKSGHKLLALFGAAQTTGRDELRAVRAAVELAQLKAPELSIRVGATHGQLLCGEVGTEQRREFTVMGNAVNLAARLMAKAEDGTVLLDEAMRGLVGDFCRMRERRIALKGVGEDVPVYELAGWSGGSRQLPATGKLHGRARELEQLRGWLRDRSGTDCLCVEISGEAGIGKTALVAAALQQPGRVEVVYIDATKGALRHSGWLIGEILTAVAGISPGQLVSDDKILERAGVDEHWRPLLSALFGEAAEDNAWTRGLTSELRVEKTAELAMTLLRGHLGRVVLILDACENADSFAQAVLSRLLPRLEAEPATVTVISRNGGLAPAAAKQLALFALDQAELLAWLGEVLISGKRESELAAQIVESSQGNPLLVATTLAELIQNGSLQRLSDPVRYEVTSAVGAIVLHRHIEDIILARYDAVSETQRQMLRAAAIFSTPFSIDDLLALLPRWDRQRAAASLTELLRTGFLRHEGTEGAGSIYAFAGAHVREAIYGRIPVLELRQLHGVVGERWEQRSTPVAQLAYHFVRSNDSTKAFRYSLKAAQASERSGSLIEAGLHYENCRQRLEDAAINDQERLAFHQAASGFALTEGNFSTAYCHLRQWRRLARATKQPEQRSEAAIEFARALWRQSRYVRCRQALTVIKKWLVDAASNTLAAECLAIEGELLRRTGKIREAQEACRSAVQLAQAAGDRAREITALNNLGLASWSAGELEAARDCFERTLAFDPQANPLSLQGRVANNLAIIHEELGDFVTARRLAEQARQAFRETGDRRNLSYSSGNLANLLFQAGRYRESAELFASADRIFVHLGERHPHFYTIGNLGDIDLHLGRLGEAAEKYQAVATYARECGDAELAAETAVRLADCRFYSGDAAFADVCYGEAIKLAAEAEAQEYLIRATVGRCRLLIGERRTKEAAALLEQLQAFARDTGSARNQHEAEFLAAEIARLNGDVESARRGYEICRGYALRQEQFELRLKALARLQEHGDERDAALTALDSLLEDFRSANGDEYFRLLLSSAYYRYFGGAMNQAIAHRKMAALPQSVG